MRASTKRKFQRELHAGLTSLLLLGFVREEPRYVYEIAKYLESHGRGPLPMKLGALYPALDSLERQGLVTSFRKPSDSGPPRRYFRISKKGLGALGEWSQAWVRMRDLVDDIIGGDHGRGS